MNEDLSNIFEKLNINKDSISPKMINNIMSMFNNSNNNSSDDTSSSDCSNSETSSSNGSPDIDIETILKIKSIMDKMNLKNDNPRSRLLQDLKPYLNESKRNKIDQYIKLDKMIELLPLLGGDFNPRLYSDNQALLLSLMALLF